MKNAHKRLLEHKVYKEWRAKNPSHQLAHAFLMLHQNYHPHWQFGFYSPDSDHIATFVISEDGITFNPETEVFKDPTKKVLQLNLSDVQKSFDEAYATAEQVCKERCKGQTINSTIAILQNTQDFGTVWNITLITIAFNTVNVKVDARTGEIKNITVDSLMSLGTKFKSDDLPQDKQ